MDFNKITIHLDKPICKCRVENLAWGIMPYGIGPGFYIQCLLCNMTIVTPLRQVEAYFNLKVQYPEQVKMIEEGQARNEELRRARHVEHSREFTERDSRILKVLERFGIKLKKNEEPPK